MMGPLRTAASAILLFLFITTSAQVSFGGRPLGPIAGRRLPAAPEITFATPDVAALSAEDAARAAAGIKGPWRFGAENATSIVMDQGRWTTLASGERIWRVMIHCIGAKGIGITFSHFVIPDGAQVFLYNEEGDVLGAYTAQSAPGQERLGVQPLPGERITIEYREPAAVSGQGDLVIGRVIHVYRAPWKGFDRDFGDSGACNVNTICPEGDDWRQEIRSVALILAGGGTCTGQLLNNCNNDSIPYFLTANHCLDGGDPTTWVFRFNWESPTCDPTDNAPTNHTVSGSTQLYANPGSDMLFLRLNSQPPPEFHTYYNGWDKSGAVPLQTTCIHHPSGDIKKITHDLDPAISENAVNVGNGPADCWHAVHYETGTTEPGSSGGGLWDQNHKIVGQLYGGSASCTNDDDWYGRFAVSYPFLEQWLGSCGDTLSGLDPSYTDPVIQYNAAVTSIYNVAASVCSDTTIAPAFTLKNNGVITLGSALIDCSITGGATNLVPWNGSLLPGQTTNVQLPPISISNGPQELIISVSLPNGEIDQDQTDDADTLNFVANTPAEQVLLELTPDNYGADITWNLTNDQGTVLYSGGPYADNNTTTIERSFCLGEGCYTFTINDEFGDGICCTEGSGHYTISSSNFGGLVESTGDYGSGEVREFCLVGIGMQENSVLPPRLFPNPTNGRITLSAASSGSGEWRVLDMAGRQLAQGTWFPGNVQTMLDLSCLPSGTYAVTGRFNDHPFAHRLVKF